MSRAFVTGYVPDEDTAIVGIMKPVSRFAKGNPHGRQRRTVVDALMVFYQRFSGTASSDEESR